jgi:hypothetical protein
VVVDVNNRIVRLGGLVLGHVRPDGVRRHRCPRCEFLTRFGGGVLTRRVHGAQSDSPSLLEPSGEQLRNAVIVLAVGGAVCLVAGMRTVASSRATSDD